MKKIKDAFSFSRSMKINAGYKSMLGLIILIDDICANLLWYEQNTIAGYLIWRLSALAFF